MATVTVVLLGPGTYGDRVQEVLGLWARDGLITSCAVVRPDQISADAHGLERIEARVIDRDGSHERELLQHLAIRRVDRLSVLAVHLLAPDVENGSLDHAASIVDKQLQGAVPLSPDGRSQASVRRINMLVPTTVLPSVSPSILRPQWDLNVVVSPEDRPDVDLPDVLVRPDDSFPGHAAAAIASIGGMWAGVRSGALDSVVSDSTTQQHDLVVIRVAARAVVGPDRESALTAEALALASDPSGKVVPFLPWCRMTPHPASLVHAAGEWLLSRPEWRSRQVDEQTKRDITSVGTAVAVRAVVLFNLRLFGAMGRWAVTGGRRQIEESLTGSLIGPDGGVRVVLTSPDSLADSARGRIGEQPISPPLREGWQVAAPDPRMWADLREVAFGLVDGTLPGDVRPPTSPGIVEVVPLASVTGPDSSWTGAGATVSPWDPSQIQEVRRMLAARVSEARGRVAKRSAGAGMERSAPETNKGAVNPPPSEGTDEEPGDVRGGSGGANELQAAQQEMHESETLLRDLGRWEMALDDAFLPWMTRRIHEQTLAAEEGLDQLAAAKPPDVEQAVAELDAQHHRLVASWKIVISLLCALVVVLAVVAALSRVSWPDAVICFVVGAAVGVACLARSHHRYFKASRRFATEVQHVLDHRRWLFDEVVKQRRELAALRLRRQILGEWCVILSDFLTAPWDTIATTNNIIGEDTIRSVPAAVALAKPVETARGFFTQRLVLQALTAVCQPGYLGRLWRSAQDRFREDMGLLQSSHPPLDQDTAPAPAGLKGQFVRYAAEGTPRREATNSAVEAVTAQILEGSLQLPPQNVVRVGQYATGEIQSDSSFYGSTLRSQTAFVQDPWTTEGVSRSRHLVERTLTWLPRTAKKPPGEQVELAEGSVAVRCDISRWSTTKHLRMFVVEPEGRRAVGRTPSPNQEDPDAWN